MYASGEKAQDNQSRVVANSVGQKKDSNQLNSIFVDNREMFSFSDNRTGPSQQLQRQMKTISDSNSPYQPIQKKENKTGLPDNLKSGIENLSGYSMDDVKVHRNSDKPAQIQAHAYAQGTDIHLAPGREKHLLHESWHVVQQKQGRVTPTVQMKGKVNINDDTDLEKEADVMGAKALQIPYNKQSETKSTLPQAAKTTQLAPMVLQLFRRVNRTFYHDVDELDGSNYRILRNFNTQNYRIHDIAANVVLPRVWSQAEANLLAYNFGQFHAQQASNLDQIMVALLAHLAGPGAIGPFFAPIRVVNCAGCLQVAALANTNYTFWQRIGGAQRYLFDLVNNRNLATTLTAAQVGQIQAVFGQLHGDNIANLNALVADLDKARGMGIPVDVTIARLTAIRANIHNVVIARITADHAAINTMNGGVLDPVFGNAFQNLEIPGSDPHKGGQVVVFVNYTKFLGGPLRVVYKPGDLTMDRLLFNSAASVAQELGGHLSDYQILPRVDAAAVDPRLAHYGYMEFVQADGPTNTGQMQSVYRSVGASLAMAYVFGLRDIHHENFILLNDRIQLIDMEAATTTFTGFAAMELGAMPAGLPGELCKRIAKGLAAAGVSHAVASGWMPNAGALMAEMLIGFHETLADMDPADPVHGVAIDALVTNVAQAEARFVPFATRELQTLAGLFQGALPAGPPAPVMLGQFNNLTQQLAVVTANNHGNPPGLAVELQAMLQAISTRAALHAGDVPFWSRQGEAIHGEDGALIVAHLHHPRIDTALNNEAAANARRAPGNAGTAANDLVTNAIPLFGDPSAAILAELRTLREQAGFGPPGY